MINRALIPLLSVCLAFVGLLVPAGSAQAAQNSLFVTSQVTGSFTIEGVADHQSFRKWQLDLMIDGVDPTFIALSEVAAPTRQTLATVDSRRYPDGAHQIRLRVVHSNLNYDEYFAPVHFGNGNLRPEPTPQTGLDLSAAPPDGRRWIEVDLSDQRLVAWQGDVPVLQTLVSTGRPDTPTVRGTFPIRVKLDSQRMRGPDYDLPGVPWVMYFYRGYAIHGTYWHTNFGQTMSHGCVNMTIEEAQALYEWAGIGTEVVVHD